MSKDNQLTKEDREGLALLVKHGELEFNWKDIEPIFRELIERVNDLPPARRKPKKPTFFPDIEATGLDGMPSTLEDLMMSMGYLPLPTPKLPLPKPPVVDLQANLDLNKPAWIPWFIWERTPLRKMVDKFLKTYVKINLSEKVK